MNIRTRILDTLKANVVTPRQRGLELAADKLSTMFHHELLKQMNANKSQFITIAIDMIQNAKVPEFLDAAEKYIENGQRAYGDSDEIKALKASLKAKREEFNRG
jgi:hypothetical protein